MEDTNKVPKLRINRISLGPIERRILPWMAERLPVWVTPDMLTIMGLMAAFLIGVSYWLTRYNLAWLWVVNIGFVLHWWADSLDGTLARVRHIERELYGFYVDHHSDTVSIFLICLGMGLSPIIDLKISLLLIVTYYGLSILVYLVSMTRDVFKISFAGMGPTEVRLIIIITNSVVWYCGNPPVTIWHWEFTIFGLVGLSASVIMMTFYLIFGEIERRRLAITDPPKYSE